MPGVVTVGHRTHVWAPREAWLGGVGSGGPEPGPGPWFATRGFSKSCVPSDPRCRGAPMPAGKEGKRAVFIIAVFF